MSRYLKNLLTALCGGDPYATELEELKEKYKKTSDHVCALNDLYYKAVEKWTEAEKMMVSCQALVENLRSRLADKDAELKQLAADYREYVKRMDVARQ